MAGSSNSLLKSLSTSHFRAIGRVASQWSALELTILWAIGRESGIDLTTATILAGSQNASTWCEMLCKLSGDTKSLTGKKTRLDSILERVRNAQTSRNSIVHAAWHPREEVRTGLLTTSPTVKATSKDKIKGMGIPKRGKSVFLKIEYDAAQMLAVAKEIELIEQALFEWIGARNASRLKGSGPTSGVSSTNNQLMALLLMQQPPVANKSHGLLGVIAK